MSSTIEFCQVLKERVKELKTNNILPNYDNSDQCLYNSSVVSNNIIQACLLLFFLFLTFAFMKIVQIIWKIKNFGGNVEISTRNSEKKMTLERFLFLLFLCLPLFFVFVQISSGPFFIYIKMKRNIEVFTSCPQGIELHNTSVNSSASIIYKLNTNSSFYNSKYFDERKKNLITNGTKINCLNKQLQPKEFKMYDLNFGDETEHRPLEIEFEKKPTNDQILVAAYFFVGIFVPFFFSTLRKKCTDYFLFLISSFIMSICSIAFGYLDNSNSNFGILMCIRLLHGLVGAILLSFISDILKKNFDFLGAVLREIVSNAAYIVSPFIGYSLLKYFDIFILAGICLALFSILTLTYLFLEGVSFNPDHIKIKVKDADLSEKEKEKFCTLKNIKDKRKRPRICNGVVFSMLTLTFLTNFGVQSIFASLTKFIEETYKIYDFDIAITFLFVTVSAFLACFIVMGLQKLEEFTRKGNFDFRNRCSSQNTILLSFMIFGCLLVSLSFIMIGYSNNLSFFKALLVFIGIGVMFAMVPLVNVMENSLKSKKKIKSTLAEYDDEDNDKTMLMTLYNSAQCAGQCCGPAFGSFITQKVSFQFNALMIGLALMA